MWTGIRHWGLLGWDPRGLAVVHVLAADRAVILRHNRGEKQRLVCRFTPVTVTANDKANMLKFTVANLASSSGENEDGRDWLASLKHRRKLKNSAFISHCSIQFYLIQDFYCCIFIRKIHFQFEIYLILLTTTDKFY